MAHRSLAGYTYNMITRRAAFLGLGGLFVAPAVVRASSLMKLSVPATYSWYPPAGLLRGLLPEEIARAICSTQPIDSKTFTSVYTLLLPTPGFPQGRSIRIGTIVSRRCVLNRKNADRYGERASAVKELIDVIRA